MARNKDKSSGGSGEGSSLSDEEWAEFERSFTKDSTKSAAYKEPSARQRELTEKWKKDQPKDTGWRTDGARADLSPKPGGGSGGSGGSGASGASTGRRRRPWIRNLAWALVALVVTVVAIGGPKMFSSSKSSDAATSSTPGSTSPIGSTPPAGTSSSSGSAPASPTYTNPDDRYFDGSKSMDWQNGEAGIVVPAAARIGDYSAKAVGDAYGALRQMLITADLDPAVLGGAEPTAEFKVLDPSEGIQKDYEKRIAEPGRDGATNDPKAFATRFNPKTTAVLGKTVKVHGSMSAALDKGGNLIVTGDYSFVYALAPAGSQGQEVDRSLVRRVWNLEVQPTTAARASGYWLSGWWYDIANDRCNVADGFINPSFGTDGGVNTGKTVDPYATTPPPSAPDSEPSSSASSSSSTNECDAVKPV
ncbi:hypothetical protein ABIA31_000100 [Catenulispora sp. MAP5-51]|uniref:hypothetical protein n=1 Tax=Catenulispora sp. MAP5-51 TaxID=3156298 RepID=UPI00351945A3